MEDRVPGGFGFSEGTIEKICSRCGKSILYLQNEADLEEDDMRLCSECYRQTHKLEIQISEPLFFWMSEQVNKKKFRTISHAIEYAIKQLKEKEG